ncbi:hypothetical protein [Nitrosospira multiformis]|uniref:hypothetical protein n=1 Tax=Nitrosospira multiformis TaxID=1231 RepID=UPI00210C118E|nr:hypothetical protein [Nitrosospira multiformis]
MENIPGRGGAVTGGAFDQSNGAPAVGVAGAAAGAAGVPAALAAGAGSAAKTWHASPNVPAPRHHFKSDPGLRAGNVLGLAALIPWEIRGRSRFMAEVPVDPGEKCPQL